MREVKKSSFYPIDLTKTYSFAIFGSWNNCSDSKCSGQALCNKSGRCRHICFISFERLGGAEPTLNYERWWNFSQTLLRWRVAAVFQYETPVPVSLGENSPPRGCRGGISCAFILWQGLNPKVFLVEERWSSGEHYDPLVIWQSRCWVTEDEGYDLCVLTALSSSVLSYLSQVAF